MDGWLECLACKSIETNWKKMDGRPLPPQYLKIANFANFANSVFQADAAELRVDPLLQRGPGLAAQARPLGLLLREGAVLVSEQPAAPSKQIRP